MIDRNYKAVNMHSLVSLAAPLAPVHTFYDQLYHRLLPPLSMNSLRSRTYSNHGNIRASRQYIDNPSQATPSKTVLSKLMTECPWCQHTCSPDI